jgi:predicted PurR-regulated permease PerM
MRRDISWIILGLTSAYLLYRMVNPIVDVIVYSIFVYYVGRPFYTRLQKRLKSPPTSAFITLFILLLPVTIVIIYGLGVASIELLNLMDAMHIPYAETINRVVTQYSSIAAEVKPQDIMRMAGENQNFRELWDLTTAILLSAMGVIFRLMLMFTIALYLLMDGRHLRDWLTKNIYPERCDMTKRFFDEVDTDLNKVFFSNIATAFFIAFMGSVVFTALNSFAPQTLRIPYTVLLGMICGVVSLVPAVGVALFWVPATLVMTVNAYLNGVLLTDGWFIIAFILSTAVLVDWGPNLIFKPRLTGKRIHPGLMMMAYLLGPIAFGFAGLFIGPIALVVSLNFIKVILPELRK